MRTVAPEEETEDESRPEGREAPGTIPLSLCAEKSAAGASADVVPEDSIPAGGSPAENVPLKDVPPSELPEALNAF